MSAVSTLPDGPGADHGTPGRTLHEPPTALVLGVGALAYVALGVLGRSTIVDGQTLGLVWPPAGVGLLVLGLTPWRRWPLAALVVGVSVYVLNAVTGASAAETVAFVLANVSQAVAGALVLRTLLPDLLGAGGRRPLARLRDFVAVAVAAVASSLVAALVGGLALRATTGAWSWSGVALWWGRNAAGALVVFSTAALLLAWLTGRRETPRRPSRPRPAARSWAELAAVVAVTAVLVLVAFDWQSGTSLVFPLLVPTVWVGMRFRPLVSALHSVGVSAAVLVYTLREQGPFYAEGTWYREALVSQLFIALAFGLGLLLSLGREERRELTGTLSRAQARSESQATLLSAILDSMHDGLTLVDGEGRVLMRNEAGATLAHAERSQGTEVSQYVMTDPSGAVLGHDDLPQVRVYLGDGHVSQDVTLRFVDGSPSRTLTITGRTLPPADGGPPDRAVLIYHDVTDDRAQRTSLESFAQVVAHDLRGPLGVIDGWSELLALDVSEAGDGPLAAADVAPKVERIRQSAQSMHQLIDALLASSTSRDQALSQERVDLTAVALSVADQWGSVASGQAPRIVVEDLPDVVADEAMVRQLLDNLVSNAVKYVVPGETPQVRISGSQEGHRVEVVVADDGIGIAAQERDDVFEAYHRAPGAQEYDGHGIGLAVCRRIVERHGGTIAAKPPPDGRGTRIVFTLPGVTPDDAAS